MKLNKADSFESVRNTIAAFIGALLWSNDANDWTEAERETVFKLADVLLAELEDTILNKEKIEKRMDA